MNAAPLTRFAPTACRRIATYERVSSEDQRNRETILMQTEALARRLEAEPEVELVERFQDDGVSGCIPFRLRPGGARLLAAAEQGLMDEVWVYRIDRLGRDDVDPMLVWRKLDDRGIAVHSLHEGQLSPFIFHIHVAVAAEERRTFLRRSADGMARAAAEGRYCGGIVSTGYRVEGERATARLVPDDDEVLAAGMTPAEVMRHVYRRLALDHFTCWGVAAELNALSIPTPYKRMKGKRTKHTRGIWTAGEVRQKVKNPIYRGELQYGRRSTKQRDIISAPIEPLVSDDLWYAAQDVLASNRTLPKNTPRTYVLRGVITCGNCGRTYCGTHKHDVTWYRCNGHLRRLQGIEGGCHSLSVKGERLEEPIQADLEAFLRNPGVVLDELHAEMSAKPEDPRQDECTRLKAAQADQRAKRERTVDLAADGLISRADCARRLSDIDMALIGLEGRLKELTRAAADVTPLADDQLDLLEQIRQRLDEGLTEQQWQELASLLVRVTVHTNEDENGKRSAKAVIEYRFPEPVQEANGVVDVSRGIPASRDYTICRRTIELPTGRQRQAGP